VSGGGGRNEIRVRAAGEADRTALATFRCSTGRWYEQEVEDHVRADALRAALASPGAYRLLVVHEERRLIACAAHQPEVLVRNEGRALMTTRLQVLALALEQRGRRLADGRKLADLVMGTLIRDALETRPGDVLTGIVARENVASLTLCERHGLRSQISHGARYVRLSGRFVAS
jgi:hypothetical protein